MVSIPAFDELDRLRKAREHASLDQAALAEKLGVSRNTVGRWEGGKTPVTRMVFAGYSLATEVPIEWLETGTTPQELHPNTPARRVAGDQRARRDSNPQPSGWWSGPGADGRIAKVIPLDGRRAKPRAA